MGRIVKAAGVDRSALIPLQSDEARAAARLVIRARRAAAGIARSARQQVIELSLHIAEQIVLREVSRDDAALEAIYRRALEAAQGLTDAVVRVHPEDRIRCEVERLAAECGFSCTNDETVGRAGCVIVAGGESVDATLKTALECFEEAMKDGEDDNT